MAYIIELEDDDFIPTTKPKAVQRHVPHLATVARQIDQDIQREKKFKQTPRKKGNTVKEITPVSNTEEYNPKSTYLIIGDTTYEIPELDAKFLKMQQIGAYVYRKFGREALVNLKVIKKGQVLVA